MQQVVQICPYPVQALYVKLWKNNSFQYHKMAYQVEYSTFTKQLIDPSIARIQLFIWCTTIINGFQERTHRKLQPYSFDLSAALTGLEIKLIEILYLLGVSGNILLWINDF
ncbi:hypothetical protein TNCT_542801 [Trichonephila clavata]|uniref:Uncharacterized protein n=1 Tax=Trichonephila clavata TaxID=2740835 RepID=A0A8X6KH07_TRICU|nr:hypothetical protein TNCT_542801 [Trichonephila clavata]